jgi:hypothetical protein
MGHRSNKKQHEAYRMHRRRWWQWVIRPMAMPEGGFAGMFSQPSLVGCIGGSGKSTILDEVVGRSKRCLRWRQGRMSNKVQVVGLHQLIELF